VSFAVGSSSATYPAFFPVGAVIGGLLFGASMRWEVLFVLGIPVGAFLAARRDGPVRASKASPTDTGKRFFGGFGLGGGSSLAAGCTVGHGLTGVPLLAPGSIVAVLAIFAGSAITSLWVVRGAERSVV
jgi:uncharacterized membrane protein YedE/YeeE